MWWNSVKELIEYARKEKPDAYEVLKMANKIAAEWKEQQPPSTNDENVEWWNGFLLSHAPKTLNG